MECVSTPVFVDAEQTAFTMLGSPLTTPSVVNESRLSVSSGNRYCRNGCTLDDAVDRQYIYAPLWHYDSASNMYIDLSLVGQLDPWQAVWVQTGQVLTGSAELLFPTTSPGIVEERSQASRFLAQTTFGPTTFAINALLETNYSSWIDEQINMPITS
ncbi:unnamed protein product, partial [Hapterophycus canaliculatus]